MLLKVIYVLTGRILGLIVVLCRSNQPPESGAGLCSRMPSPGAGGLVICAGTGGKPGRQLPGALLTRWPSTSSVLIVTNWSRTPGAHGTSGTAW